MSMPIDLSTVKLGSTLQYCRASCSSPLCSAASSAFRNKVAAAFIAAVLFAAVFVFWTYYPRDNFPDAIKSMPTSAK